MTNNALHRKFPRRGASSLELVVLGGGMTLGVFLGALLLFRSGTPDRSAPTESPTLAEPDSKRDSRPVEDDTVARLQNENERLRAELRAARRPRIAAKPREKSSAGKHKPSPPRSQPRPVAAVRKSSPTPPTVSKPASKKSTGQKTLEYWNGLNAVIEQEEGMRTPPAGGITAANAGDFLNRRQAAGKFATNAIGKLSREDVDPEVIDLAMSIAAWYDQGSAVSRTGKNLLERSDPKTRRGSKSDQYKNSEKKLRTSVAEINRRGEALRRKISKRYGRSFPKLR